MHVISTDDGSATVSLSGPELSLLNNALNETLEAVADDELAARVGASGDAVRALLGEVRDTLSALG